MWVLGTRVQDSLRSNDFSLQFSVHVYPSCTKILPGFISDLSQCFKPSVPYLNTQKNEAKLCTRNKNKIIVLFAAASFPKCHPKSDVGNCIASSLTQLIHHGSSKLLISLTESFTSIILEFTLCFPYFQNITD